jgi:DNA transformation protein
MAVSPGFRTFILDLLGPLQPSANRLFGGVGIMTGGTMFALLWRDELYLRVDDRTRERFLSAGCAPLDYKRAGRAVLMESYYAVPEGLYDQPDELVSWAREAIGVAQRKQNPRQRRKRAHLR